MFNILTQVSCYFIYLIIYPATFPEKPQLDPFFFTVFSIIYILANIAFLVLFNKARRKKDYSPAGEKQSHLLLLVFIFFYVVFEGFETMLEVEISGNIYRFLAIFFVTAFLPILRRREKFLSLTVFLLVTEAGFAYLVSQGLTTSNAFQEIAVLFYIVCLVVSIITYNTGVRTFMLKQELVTANESLREANEKLELLSTIDPLTEIANRRAFDQYMALVWRKGFTDKDLVSVVMIDIDNFKVFNDTYGHQAGDDCLKRVSQCIDTVFERETDMVARYGGEEFIVLAVSDTLENMAAMTERVRASVEAMHIENENSNCGKYVTISAGVAAVVSSIDMRYEDLIKLADDALYQAKETGKNRVCLAD